MEHQVKIEWDMSLPEDQSDNGLKTGSWSIHENLLYAIFITQNKATMVSKRKRKNFRIFDRMSDFIVSRNSLQCRSHHQKLIEKFMEIKNIINAFKKYFGNQYFREQTLLFTSKKPSTDNQSVQDQQNINSQILPEEEEAVQDQRPESGSCGEEQMKTPDVIRSEDGEERPNVVAGSCRTEETLQCNYPMGYYYGNGFVQFPFYGFYPGCAYQTI